MSKKSRVKRRNAPITSANVEGKHKITTTLPDISPTRSKVSKCPKGYQKSRTIKPLKKAILGQGHRQTKSEGDIQIRSSQDPYHHQNIIMKHHLLKPLTPLSAAVTPTVTSKKVQPKRAQSLNRQLLARTKTYVVLDPIIVKKPRSEDTSRYRRFEDTTYFGSRMSEEERDGGDLRALDDLFKSLKLSHAKEMSLLATRTSHWRP